MNFLKRTGSFVKANIGMALFIVFVGALFVAPFLFWAFNKARSMAPDAVKKIVPAAKPIDAEAIVEKATPAATPPAT